MDEDLEYFPLPDDQPTEPLPWSQVIIATAWGAVIYVLFVTALVMFLHLWRAEA